VSGTATGTPGIKYQYADYAAAQAWATAAEVEAAATWNGSWLTQAELRLIADTDLRYRYLKIQLMAGSGESFDELSTDAYTVDVTPPDVPASTFFALFETDNFALIWREPLDADFSHCELRRDIDETTEYLDVVVSMPEWTESSANPFEFADGDLTKDSPFSNYIDEDVTGTDIAYFVRSVDGYGNASAWTPFTIGDVDYPVAGNVLLGVAYGNGV
jgi:hypothetical protein